MFTRTKIICTMGPAVASYEKKVELIEAGMDVARVNFSHGTHEEHRKTIELLKKARQAIGKAVAIMLDTRGPEIRIGAIKGGSVALEPGDRWLLVKEEIEGGKEMVSLNPGHVIDQLHQGTRVLFNDGYITSHIVEKNSDGVVVEIEHGGVIHSRKGVNIPAVSLNLPAMTERDMEDIRFGCQMGVDLIAASFIRSAEHVMAIKKLLGEENGGDIAVIAKIESIEGVQNFDGIVQVADGIMVARGDLGVEVPISSVPKLQKMMIRKSYLAGKPVVTATQMLESMIHSSRPTRAEVSDVANAIYDSTSAVMLSAETAVGSYPIETVKIMKEVVKEAEEDFDYLEFFQLHSKLVYHDVPSAVTLATVKTAYSSDAKAVFGFTCTGSTTRLLSRLRPPMPIVVMSTSEKTYHQMAFNWGVIPHWKATCHTMDEAFLELSRFATKEGIVSEGDLVIVTAGTPFGVPGTTNMMIVENIGDVLVRGHSGLGEAVYGNVALLTSPEERPLYEIKGKLLVITRCDEAYIPFLRDCLGIILQNHISDEDSERFACEMAESLQKPLLVRADEACRILKEDQLVTLVPDKALVYKGVR